MSSLPYPLKGQLGTIDIPFAESDPFSKVPQVMDATFGAFTLPINSEGRVLLALRDDKPTIPYPGHWNCIGGGAEPDEGSPDLALGREFTEESWLSLGNIVGRIGRPLTTVLRKPKKPGEVLGVDIAEAYLVEFEGDPKPTDESRTFDWFDWDRLVSEPKIVGKDVRPFGRTIHFILWGLSVGRAPCYDGELFPDLMAALAARYRKTIHLTAGPNIVLLDGDRYLARVSVDGAGTPRIRLWHNLSIEEECLERGGIRAGGFLES